MCRPCWICVRIAVVALVFLSQESDHSLSQVCQRAPTNLSALINHAMCVVCIYIYICVHAFLTTHQLYKNHHHCHRIGSVLPSDCEMCLAHSKCLMMSHVTPCPHSPGLCSDSGCQGFHTCTHKHCNVK